MSQRKSKGLSTARVPFSQRYKTRPSGLVLDSLPDGVPIGIANLLRSVVNPSDYRRYVEAICLETDTAIPRGTGLSVFNLDPGYSYNDVHGVLKRLSWDRLCDACEKLSEIVEPPRQFEQGLNQVFARNYFGYEIRDGKIERVGATTQKETIDEAHGILSDSELAGPSRQFTKAMEAFNKRPTPDLENAVKDGVGAVEGLARILLGDPALLLSHALPKLQREKTIPQQLKDVLLKLYAYRSDGEAIAHGGTNAKPEVRLEDAEFALSVSASAIVYLARLYGRGVQ